MDDPYRSKPRRGRTNLASCLVAAVFLLCIGAAITTVYFILFKPKHPQIAVNAVQFPTFTLSNGTVNFTFFQFVTVTNPNRDTFTHYDSSLQLDYSGDPVGFVFIPAGRIYAGRSQRMSAKFEVDRYPVPEKRRVAAVVGDGVAAATTAEDVMEIETKMKLVGRVRVLKVFTHRVESEVKCSVDVRVTDGSVLALHC
ncbi:proline-rich receptor-like protein kinase PERK3 [Heracleum sosnowskyi]|uniref:Proline-rich receptor-like protein kinase PERK3 n=1 Tax=Heracleum sosnowskyi TaxID=360622 RepID=A0AAD8HDR6_9APIA|nr:proline-rich receptor-like protein kinase PERK3 [Heracleum sosnowskyi]